MKKNDLKILKFPSSVANLERQVEAILFSAEEPLDETSIQEKLKARTNISKILDSQTIKITRLARGLPVGGHLEYVDEATLIRAMEGRTSV